LSDFLNPNELYDKIVQTQNQIGNFWGEIPRSYGDAIELVKRNFLENNRSQTQGSKLNRLKEFLIKFHDEMGITSQKVLENIGFLDNGSILMGQQPIVFGGPGFIGNKFGCLTFLDRLSRKEELNLAPVFFIGDYDGLQKELTRTYFPNPISQAAVIIDSSEYLSEDSNIAVHRAKIPPLSWLTSEIENLASNLRGFQKQIKGPSKFLFEERWDHISTILKTSYQKSSTLSEWATRIWGYLANIVADLGIVFLPTSHPEVRKLVASEYHKYISNGKLYADTFQKATKDLEEIGFKPTLPHRHSDYAPFTLECEEDGTRVTTSIISRDNDLWAEGICTCCDQSLSFKVTSESDLEKIATTIGPRVDSSQAIFQDLMGIKIRISGPGEIAYYAQAAPAVKALGFNLPVFVKYKRAFYNTNWIEKLGHMLNTRKQPSLHQSTLFSLLRERFQAIKQDNAIEIQSAESSMQDFIMSEYDKFSSHKKNMDIQKYLGWQYGKFDQFKFGQEVSWSWIDLALQTGARDYINTYSRIYHKDSLIGSMFYINTSI
jgi:uncharacterized protein YllA (UPF0747 family)